ncbi:MAG: hypothetical protein ABI175_15500 [Polyangiales bacterium]
MRILLLAILVTGCTEHGSSPPLADAKLFLDAPVTMCLAPNGSAEVTASPGLAFAKVYAGGVLLSGPAQKGTGAPFALQMLFTNLSQADLEVGGVCDGNSQPNCMTDGLALHTTTALERDAEVGTHSVTLRRTISGPAIQGMMTVTEFMNPFDALPGHITGTVSATGVSGSFSTVFCPPFLAVTI